MLRHSLTIFTLAWLALLQAAAPAEAQARPRVIASFSILGELTQRIAGDAVELRTLIGPNADAHTFDPTPADARALGMADLVIENGLAFETWLDPLYRASRSGARRVKVADVTSALPSDPTGHRHGELDPHIWHDPVLMATAVQTIREALTELDPANAERFTANAALILGELAELDAWITETVDGLPPERRKLVTTHNTFQYFAHRYGFHVVGTALGSVSTEVADPSAGQIAALIDEIRAAEVQAIFPENVSKPALMEQIATEARVRLAPPLYTDALGPRGSPGATYLGLMQHNVRTIVAALS